MREKLGYSAFGKFILITSLAKVLLVDNSLSILGGGAFLVPLIALVGGVALIFLLDQNRLRGDYAHSMERRPPCRSEW